MHELILQDLQGHEVGRRPMQPHERYGFYEACATGEPLTVGEASYRIKTVAWRMPEQDLILGVEVLTPPAPIVYDYDC